MDEPRGVLLGIPVLLPDNVNVGRPSPWPALTLSPCSSQRQVCVQKQGAASSNQYN